MRAAVHRRFGGPEVVQIEETRRPEPGPGQVLVRVHASTVSAADHRTRSKDVPRGVGPLASLTIGFLRPRRPVLAMDVAGVVESVGDAVTDFRPGDEVIAMLGHRFGGHAEFAIVDRGRAIARKPAGLSFEQAAALVFGGITAAAFLGQVTLAPAARVLVIGASGAVGTAAVQLARIAGAEVTAVCSGRNADLVRSLGAGRVIDRTTHDFTLETEAYDVVVDCAGAVPFARLERRVVAGGALLAVIDDLVGMFSARRRSRRNGKRIVTGDVPVTSAQLARLAALAADGRFAPVIDRVFDLGDIVEAHRYVDSGRKRGSVVVSIA